jgi:hypothetical protein
VPKTTLATSLVVSPLALDSSHRLLASKSNAQPSPAAISKLTVRLRHVMHNCCINSGGWTYNPDAVELTKKVCKNFTSAQWYNNACTEAAGSEPISGDSFYSACKAAKPEGGDTIGAGYRATC